MPFTTPEPEIVATAGALLLHALPPDVASLSVVVEPTHTDSVPVMAEGSGLTVIFFVAKQPELSV